jgi:hypothetical protein
MSEEKLGARKYGSATNQKDRAESEDARKDGAAL